MPVGKPTGTVGMPPQVTPQTLRRQAQRMSRVVGQMIHVGRPEDDVEAGVGGEAGRS